MRRPSAALLLVLLPAVVLGGVSGDYEDDGAEGQEQDQAQNHKEVGGYDGHSFLDLSSLGLLAALKVKFVVVLLVALAVFLLLTKSYKTQCVFGNCRPNYSTYGYYPYVDYTYMGYELPASASYRRPVQAAGAVPGAVSVLQAVPGVVAKDSHHLADLTTRVWNSIDLANMAFGALNIQEEDCRRKLVCQADRAAAGSMLLRTAMSWLNLARYRTEQHDSDASAPWRQADPCEEMYPMCQHRDLPAALGGPTRPTVFLNDPHHHHHDHHEQLYHRPHRHHHQHDHLQHLEHSPGHVVELPQEQWQPVGYRPEYQFSYYPSYEEHLEGGGGGAGPIVEPFAEVDEAVFALDSTVSVSAPPRPATQLPADAVLAQDLIEAGATGTSSASVLAPATTSTTTTSTPAPGSEVTSTAAARSGESPPEPRTPEHGDGLGDGATTSLVWRRMHFNRTKLHAD